VQSTQSARAGRAVSRRLHSSTLQESQIECREHQDNSDVYYQPRPEVVPEEQDVHADHDGYHREHIQDGACLSSHRFVLQCGTAWSKSGGGLSASACAFWHAAAVTSSRRLVAAGSPLEPQIGFSRAVRAGPYVCVAGTAPIAEGGGTAAPGDVYAQSVRCLDIAEQALQEAGAVLADVVRTRVMLTDIRQWQQAARAHAERFAQVRPACTFVEVSRFVDPQWLVEFEVDAIVTD